MLADAMDELGLDQPVEVIDVRGEKEARERKFLGSPTIRVNGLDVDASARDKTDYTMACRVYQTGEGVLHWPSKAMVVRALKDATGA